MRKRYDVVSANTLEDLANLVNGMGSNIRVIAVFKEEIERQEWLYGAISTVKTTVYKAFVEIEEVDK